MKTKMVDRRRGHHQTNSIEIMQRGKEDHPTHILGGYRQLNIYAYTHNDCLTVEADAGIILFIPPHTTTRRNTERNYRVEQRGQR